MLLTGQTRCSFLAERQDNTGGMILRLGSVVDVAVFCFHALLLWFYAKVCGLLYRLVEYAQRSTMDALILQYDTLISAG